jgi:hypothetical protein
MTYDPPETAPRNHHDMGGVSRFLCEPIDTAEHALDDFDRAVDAMSGLIRGKGLMTVDEMRRGIEEIPEAEYLAMTYYQRWLRSITATLLRKGILSEAELTAALEQP